MAVGIIIVLRNLRQRKKWWASERIGVKIEETENKQVAIACNDFGEGESESEGPGAWPGSSIRSALYY